MDIFCVLTVFELMNDLKIVSKLISELISDT